MATQVRSMIIGNIIILSSVSCFCDGIIDAQPARKAAEVRELLDHMPLDISFSLSILQTVSQSHNAIAISDRDDKIVLLCLEGSTNSVQKLNHDDSSRLAEFQLKKPDFGFLHATAISFYEWKSQEPLFLNATSFTYKNYESCCFFVII